MVSSSFYHYFTLSRKICVYCDALFTHILTMTKDSSDRNSIHTYLDRFPILFPHNRIRFLSGRTLCTSCPYLSLPFLPRQAIHTCLSSENILPDRFVLHFQRLTLWSCALFSIAQAEFTPNRT